MFRGDLHAVFDALPVHAGFIDRADRIVWINRTIEIKTGVRLAQIKGKGFNEVFPMAQKGAWMRAAVRKSGRMRRRVAQFTDPTGSALWFLVTLVPQPAGGLLIVGVDVTAQVALATTRAIAIATIESPTAVAERLGMSELTLLAGFEQQEPAHRRGVAQGDVPPQPRRSRARTARPSIRQAVRRASIGLAVSR